MKNNYKYWPLSQQIGSLALVLSIIVFSLMSYFSYTTSSSVLTEKAMESMDEQMRSNADFIDLQYNSMMQLARRNADILKVMYPGKFFLDGRKVKVLGVTSPALMHEHEQINSSRSKVDRFSKLTGGVATVFVRDENDFTRVSTSLTKADGKRAMGTNLGVNHPGYQQLINGQEYEGYARLFGKDYMTVYRPIFDDARQVIGIMFIGFDISNAISQIQETIKNLNIAQSGYFVIMRNSDSHIMAHPKIEKDSEFNPQLLNGLSKEQALRLHTHFEYTSLDNQQMTSYSVPVPGWSWTLIGFAKLDELNSGSMMLLRTIIIIAVIGIALISILLYLAINKTTRPLETLQKQFANLGEGDLSQTFNSVNANSRNEVDLITHSASNMAQNLKTLIQSMHGSVAELETQASHGQQLAEQNGQQAQSLLAQTEQIATAIEQMTASIKEVATSANHGADQSQQVDDASQEGNQQLTKVVSDLESLSQQLNQSQLNIETVTKESEAISKVTEVINGIAEQTNLLALNAAIEAARAGEQGRGFAVVADEVRSLAQRTQQSISEIGATITTLQSQVKLTANQMSHCQHLGQASADNGQQVNQQLTQISGSIQELALFNSNIASATEQQSSVANDVSQNLHTISNLAKNSDERAEQGLNASAELTQMAKEIKSQISVFKF
ncbi:methyl-accepting chemotaxis protein [Shewanella maritima]|uniref:methyl-accepting chemotaxis protein n=1 Tax=Shewanella maritima TaxID=2520507 RepID=UPI0037354C4D